MNLNNLEFEKSLFGQRSYIIAVDEVGVGCLAGPVVACAFLIYKKDLEEMYLNIPAEDSKTISEKKRLLISNLIKTSGYKYSIASVSSKRLDRIGIRAATHEAMRKSIKNLCNKNNLSNPLVIVDGPHKIKELNMDQVPIIKGDSKTISIASASIMAKVFRDKLMEKYSKIYKGYGFEINKGYGTLIHRKAIKRIGSCPIHRRSFTLI